MNKNNNKMDLLGNAPVPQALMALGIPIMIGMLINALYNLVDAYFIAICISSGVNPVFSYSASLSTRSALLLPDQYPVLSPFASLCVNLFIFPSRIR